MKKNILFVVHGLGIGGIETCLVNLLNALQDKNFNIDVLLEHPICDMKSRIRTDVNYIDVSRYLMDPSETRDAINQNGGIVKNPVWFLRYAVFRVLIKLKAEKKWKVFQRLPKHYDVAIAYSHEGYCPYYVADKVSADKKVLWYHKGVYDYPDKKRQLDLQYYDKFDSIICVSEDCKEAVAKQLPELESKLKVLSNVFDCDFVREKAEEYYPDNFDNAVNIVTVGRMSEEKQPDLALRVCKRLVDSGHNIKWHWVGDGVYGSTIAKQIKEAQMEKFFIPEGNVVNPYPYIKNADIYVQTSRYEAFCTTIVEAKMLDKPIIATNVGGVRKQIDNNKTGLIVDNNESALVDAIDRLIRNPELRQSFENELKSSVNPTVESLEEYMKTIFS